MYVKKNELKIINNGIGDIQVKLNTLYKTLKWYV